MAKDIFAQCFDYTFSNGGLQLIVPKMKLLSTLLCDERYGGMIIEIKLNHSKFFKKEKEICSVYSVKCLCFFLDFSISLRTCIRTGR